jgi:hypothetical protein
VHSGNSWATTHRHSLYVDGCAASLRSAARVAWLYLWFPVVASVTTPTAKANQMRSNSSPPTLSSVCDTGHWQWSQHETCRAVHTNSTIAELHSAHKPTCCSLALTSLCAFHSHSTPSRLLRTAAASVVLVMVIKCVLQAPSVHINKSASVACVH